MRKLIVTVALSLAFAGTPLSAHAQVQFLAGALFGRSLAPAASATAGSPDAIFTAPDDLLRKVDPMKIRHRTGKYAYFYVAPGSRSYVGMSNDQLFKISFENSTDDPTKHILLQITRVISVESGTAMFWFAYVDKDDIKE